MRYNTYNPRFSSKSMVYNTGSRTMKVSTVGLHIFSCSVVFIFAFMINPNLTAPKSCFSI